MITYTLSTDNLAPIDEFCGTCMTTTSHCVAELFVDEVPEDESNSSPGPEYLEVHACSLCMTTSSTRRLRV